VNLDAILEAIETPPTLDREALWADLLEVRRLHMFENAARDRPAEQRPNKEAIVRLIKELNRRIEGQWWLHRYRPMLDEMLVETGRAFPIEASDESAVVASVVRLRDVFERHIGQAGYTWDPVAEETRGVFVDFAFRALDQLEIRGKRGEHIQRDSIPRLLNKAG